MSLGRSPCVFCEVARDGYVARARFCQPHGLLQVQYASSLPHSTPSSSLEAPWHSGQKLFSIFPWLNCWIKWPCAVRVPLRMAINPHKPNTDLKFPSGHELFHDSANILANCVIRVAYKMRGMAAAGIYRLA